MPVGFIRRYAAFFLDGLILGGIGFLLSVVARSWLVGLGPNGKILGLGIAISYFTAFNSRFLGGQTIGKRILGVRVVDKLGQPISILRSSWRAFILCSAYFLNGAEISLVQGSIFSTLVMIGLGVVVFGFGSAILYFSIFDRPYHRGFHDLIAGTLVVRKDMVPPESVPVSRRVAVGYVVLLALIVGGIAFLNFRVGGSGAYQTAKLAMEVAKEHPGVISVPRASFGPPMYLTLRTSAPLAEFRKTIPSLCKALQHAIPDDHAIKDTGFILVYGFDIGIASLTESSRASCQDRSERTE